MPWRSCESSSSPGQIRSKSFPDIAGFVFGCLLALLGWTGLNSAGAATTKLLITCSKTHWSPVCRWCGRLHSISSCQRRHSNRVSLANFCQMIDVFALSQLSQPLSHLGHLGDYQAGTKCPFSLDWSNTGVLRCKLEAVSTCMKLLAGEGKALQRGQRFGPGAGVSAGWNRFARLWETCLERGIAKLCLFY